MKQNKKLISEIKRVEKKLIKRVEKKGMYENFGDEEQRRLKDKWIDISSYTDEMNENRRLLANFTEWCATYNG